MSWLWLAAVMAGATGAALVLRWARMPMWAITGGVVGAALVHLASGESTHLPAFASPVAQILVGAAVGTAIGPSILRVFRRILVPGIVVVVAVVVTGISLGMCLSALGLLPTPVAVLGMVPGGVGEMVAAALTLHTDSATVAAIHLVRLLAVVWSLPLLMRWARRFGGPDDGSDPGEDKE